MAVTGEPWQQEEGAGARPKTVAGKQQLGHHDTAMGAPRHSHEDQWSWRAQTGTSGTSTPRGHGEAYMCVVEGCQ